MFGAIAGGIASALAGGAMSKLFGGGQKAASGGIQGDVLATDNNTVGMGDACIKSAIQGCNVPNPDEAVPSFDSGDMAKAGKGLLEGTLQAGTSAVSDKLLALVGLGGQSAADKGKHSRDYLAAAFPELNAWERAGADASSAGMVEAGLLEGVLAVIEDRRRRVVRHRVELAVLGVVANHRLDEVVPVDLDLVVLHQLVHRVHRARQHHGLGPDLEHLHDVRRVLLAIGRDGGGE